MKINYCVRVEGCANNLHFSGPQRESKCFSFLTGVELQLVSVVSGPKLCWEKIGPCSRVTPGLSRAQLSSTNRQTEGPTVFSGFNGTSWKLGIWLTALWGIRGWGGPCSKTSLEFDLHGIGYRSLVLSRLQAESFLFWCMSYYNLKMNPYLYKTLCSFSRLVRMRVI